MARSGPRVFGNMTALWDDINSDKAWEVELLPRPCLPGRCWDQGLGPPSTPAVAKPRRVHRAQVGGPSSVGVLGPWPQATPFPRAPLGSSTAEAHPQAAPCQSPAPPQVGFLLTPFNTRERQARGGLELPKVARTPQ